MTPSTAFRLLPWVVVTALVIYVMFLRRETAADHSAFDRMQDSLRSAITTRDTLIARLDRHGKELEMNFVRLSSQDNPTIIYRKARARWNAPDSVYAALRYLRTRPDTILDRQYPGRSE